VGALLAGFFLPTALGVGCSVYVAAGINLLIGVIALFVRDGPAPVTATPDREIRPAAAAGRHRLGAILVFVAAASGFGSLALEVVYIRMLSHRSEGSVYSFALMLVTFLLFLAAGSGVVAYWGDRVNPWRLLAWTQLAAVAAILVSQLLYLFIPLLAAFSEQDTLTTRLLKLGLGSAVVLGPPVLLIGVVLPCAWKIAGGSSTQIGARVGMLSAVNTLAAVAGSLVTGFVCLPWLGLGGATLLVAGIYALLAMSGFWSGFTGFGRWAGCLASVALVGVWYLVGAWQVNLQPLAEGETLLSYRDGETASVAVIQQRSGHRVLQMNHEYVLGSTASVDREVRQGRIPLLLHPQPDRVALIGVGTGMTASAVKDFPVKRVVAVELVPGVAAAQPYFQPWNRSFDADPRVELVVEDGRNYLLGTSEQFDVIISDLFVPWHAGTGDLYTVEHFQVARRRLAPGGVFAQWLPCYQLTVDELRTISASLLEAFPASTLWRNDFHTEFPILCLVGYRDGLAIDPARVAAACERLAETKRPPAPMLSSPAGLQMLYVCGDAALRDWVRGAPLNTDDRPSIEYTTPRSLFEHRQKSLASMHELIAGFRPRRWCYRETLAPDRRVDQVFRAADLMQDANRAMSRNNFEQEFRCLTELVDVAGDVRGVGIHVLQVAARYRGRHMSERSNVLLAALAAYPKPLLGVLVGLAEARRAEGNDAEAIMLLERAVGQAPKHPTIRRSLVELLKGAGRFEEAEPHLRHLLGTKPNDPYLRLDLVHVLDRQGKVEDARRQMAEFKRRWDGQNRKTVWQYLRTLELGDYVEESPPGPPVDQPDVKDDD